MAYNPNKKPISRYTRWWQLKCFLEFSPRNFGEDSDPFWLDSYFSDGGWFNHQLVQPIGIRSPLESDRFRRCYDEVQVTEAAEGQESLEAPVECLSDWHIWHGIISLPAYTVLPWCWYLPYGFILPLYVETMVNGIFTIYGVSKTMVYMVFPYKPNMEYLPWSRVNVKLTYPNWWAPLKQWQVLNVRFLGCNPFPFSPWDWYICLHVT